MHDAAVPVHPGYKGGERETLTLRTVVGGSAVTVILMVPGVASADKTSTQGQDYSRDYNGGHGMLTCDQEGDSRHVHSDVQMTNLDTIGKYTDDVDGANGICAYSGYDSRVVRRHRTVEEARFQPDEFGNYVDTGYR